MTNVSHIDPLNAGLQAQMPHQRLAFGLTRRAGVAPTSSMMSLGGVPKFAAPAAALSGAGLRIGRLRFRRSAQSEGAPHQ